MSEGQKESAESAESAKQIFNNPNEIGENDEKKEDKIVMRLSLNTILTTYLDCVCDGNDFANEDEFRDALVEELENCGYKVQTEYKINADPRSGKDYWLIDIMVQTDQNELVPIELKFNEESVQEIQEDIEKIIYLQENNIHMKRGYVILLTNANPSNFENQLKATINPSYRYAKWYI